MPAYPAGGEPGYGYQAERGPYGYGPDVPRYDRDPRGYGGTPGQAPFGYTDPAGQDRFRTGFESRTGYQTDGGYEPGGASESRGFAPGNGYRPGPGSEAGVGYRPAPGYEGGPGYEPRNGYAPGSSYQSGPTYRPDPGYEPGTGYASDTGYGPGTGYQPGAGYEPDSGYQSATSYEAGDEYESGAWYEPANGDQGSAGYRPGASYPPVPGGPGYEFGYGFGIPEPVEPQPRALEAGAGDRAGQGISPDDFGAGQGLDAGAGYEGAAGYGGAAFADDFIRPGFGPGDNAGPARGLAQPVQPASPAPPAATGAPGYEFGYSPADEAFPAPANYVYTPTVAQPQPSRAETSPGPSGPPGFEFTGSGRVGQSSTRAPLALPAGPGGRQDGDRDDPNSAQAGWARLRALATSRPATRDTTPGGSAHPPPLSREGVKRWALRVALPAMSMVAVGVAAVATFGGSSGAAGPAPATLNVGFPPATSAAGAFTATPADQARGISQSLSRVASSGSVVVAAGSQAGARIGRAQFFVSVDRGRTWRLAPERAQDGGDPPPGHAAGLIAGGQGGWLALGPNAIWTSQDGMSWTLASTGGIAPVQRGDRVNVLRRTATGFLAAGENVPPGDPAATTPVVWTSSNGVTWQRLGAAQLHLTAAGAVGSINFAAVSGNTAVISGNVTKTVQGAVTASTAGAWRSTDGGATWTAVNVPVSNGAANTLAGLAATGNGFVAIRPGQSKQAGADAVAYASADGATWKFGATITSPGGLGVGVVNGGPAGAVVTGQGGGATVAFTSANGTSWSAGATISGAAGPAISGVAVAADGTVVAAGSAAGQVSQQAVLTVDTAGRVSPVNIAAIPGATEPEVAVNGIAASGSSQVAVGSANGFPATWVSADAGTTWTRGAGAPAAALDRPGLQELSGVAHGPAGWVAVGGVRSAAAPHPVVVTSPTGQTWQAADASPAFAGSGLFTVAAAAGPRGYVIVGRQVIQGRSVPAAWWSAGLAGWQRAAGLGGAGAPQQMLAAASSAGGFVAVGSASNRPAAWTSANGQTWKLASLALPPDAVRAQLQQVTVNGRRIVAIGMSATSAGQTAPFAAESVNGGATWTESLLPSPDGASAVDAVDAVAATGAGFTATGTFGTGGRRDVVIWTSTDGLTWKTNSPSVTGLGGQGIQEITALAVSGSTLTGVGFTASPTSESPTIWRSPIRG